MKNSIKFIFKMPNAYHQVALDYFFFNLFILAPYLPNLTSLSCRVSVSI